MTHRKMLTMFQPVVALWAELSISFEQLRLPDHSEPGSPWDDNDHIAEVPQAGFGLVDHVGHLYSVGCVSVSAFEDKVLAWNFTLLIVMAVITLSILGRHENMNWKEKVYENMHTSS